MAATSTSASPQRTLQEGKEYDRPDAEAQDLIHAGAAVPVKSGEVETAAQGPEETAEAPAQGGEAAEAKPQQSGGKTQGGSRKGGGKGATK